MDSTWAKWQKRTTNVEDVDRAILTEMLTLRGSGRPYRGIEFFVGPKGKTMDVGQGSRRASETAWLPTRQIGVSISEYKEEYNYGGVDLTKSVWYTGANTQLLDGGSAPNTSRALSFNGIRSQVRHSNWVYEQYNIEQCAAGHDM